MRFIGSGLVAGVGFALILLMGATIGANTAAHDEPLPDVDGRLEAEMFAADGSIAADTNADRPGTPVPTGQAVADWLEPLFPETPRLDAAVQQALVRPLLLAGIWLADVGARIGYVLATAIGVQATSLLLQGAVLGLLGVPCYRLYRLYGEVSDR